MSDSVGTTRGDAEYAVRKFAKTGMGRVSPLSPEDALAGLKALNGDVGLEFAPEGQLRHAQLSWTGEAFAVDGYDAHPEWDADALSRHEAAAILDGATLFKPVRGGDGE